MTAQSSRTREGETSTIIGQILAKRETNIKAIDATFRTCIQPEGNERFCRIIRDLTPCKLTPNSFVNASVQLWTTLGARRQNVHADFGGEIIYGVRVQCNSSLIKSWLIFLPVYSCLN